MLLRISLHLLPLFPPTGLIFAARGQSLGDLSLCPSNLVNTTPEERFEANRSARGHARRDLFDNTFIWLHHSFANYHPKKIDANVRQDKMTRAMTFQISKEVKVHAMTCPYIWNRGEWEHILDERQRWLFYYISPSLFSAHLNTFSEPAQPFPV